MPKPPNRILGIDPSSSTLGWVVLASDGALCDAGPLKPKGLPHELLKQVHAFVAGKVTNERINDVALEKVNYNWQWDTGILKVVIKEIEETVKTIEGVELYTYTPQGVYGMFKIPQKADKKKERVAAAVVEIWPQLEGQVKDVTDAAAI